MENSLVDTVGEGGRGRIEGVTWKHTHYHVENREPVGRCCMLQGAQTHCSGTPYRGRKEQEVGGSFRKRGHT